MSSCLISILPIGCRYVGEALVRKFHLGLASVNRCGARRNVERDQASVLQKRSQGIRGSAVIRPGARQENRA